MKHTHLLAIAAIALLTSTFSSCVDEESDLGINLVDPGTLYNGIADTLYTTSAVTRFDDSLRTSDYSFGIIGNYTSTTFGSVNSVLYTQVALSSTDNSINTEGMVVDSVFLTLVNDMLFPDTAGTYNFHFEVRRLSQAVEDTTYYACDELPVASGAALFDATVTVRATDTIITLPLNGDVASMLVDGNTYSAEDYSAFTKGLRISILPDGDQGMLSINFASVDTRLRAYYHRDTNSSYYDFSIATGAKHFTHFAHDYTGTPFASGADVDGSQKLYLEPMGGHVVVIDFDSAICAFAKQHPRAVIHYAELIMPVASLSPVEPDMIVAVRTIDGVETYINDFLSSGVDGTYNAETNRYRMRVSQHLQGLIRAGHDEGLKLVLNSRRSSAASVVLNGTQANDPVRIEFVYTE